MTAAFRALHAPKEGNGEDEYEDAYAPAGGPAPGESVFTAALADGASASLFAREWARLLVEELSKGPLAPDEALSRAAALGERWRRGAAERTLPWYAEEKLPQGAHAALLTVTWDLGAGCWRAMAVGDSCLFLVRDGRLVRAFPLEHAGQFGSRPPLLGTEPAGDMAELLETAEGELCGGDRFLLATDALAAWLLAESEAGRAPWDLLPTDENAFPGWLAERRESGALRNDDVTLLELTVSG